MKTAIVYYSLSGNTKLLAEQFALCTEGDLFPLQTGKQYGDKGAGMFWSGKSALLQEKPALQVVLPDLSGYDRIFIGTPVWAWTYAPPVGSLFAANAINGKEVVLFATHGGGPGKVFERMEKQLPGNRFIGHLEMYEPKKQSAQQVERQVREFCKGLGYGEKQ